MNTAQRTFRERVGELRPSQLLYTWGIGTVVDLQKTTVMVLGIDDWRHDDTEPLEEPRLLQAVRQELGPQVHELRTPPQASERDEDWQKRLTGIPVAPFPRWLVCPFCRLLAPIESGLFRLTAPQYRPEESGYVHDNCQKANRPNALPVRFLVACRNGHLDDFPWVDFVHQGGPCQRPQLQLFERGASGQAADITVKCRSCGASQMMSRAFDVAAGGGSFPCTGLSPQLRQYDATPCDEPAKPMLLGASNIWFPRVISALSIPRSRERLDVLIEEHLDQLADLTDRELVAGYRAARRRQLRSLREFSDDELWDALTARRESRKGGKDGRINVRAPEWETFINPDSAPETKDFLVREVAVPETFVETIESVVLVERLREIRAFVGFNRVQSSNDFGDISGIVQSERLAPISDEPPRWVPASDVRGEGIFIRFRENMLQDWENRIAGMNRPEEFENARRYRLIGANRIEEAANRDPGLIRKALLHTFSHALMRQLGLESGYSTTSLRERVYSLPAQDPEGPMAGVLIMTAASDSEGTLGGLVRMGEPDRLGPTLHETLANMEICASDPLCSEHGPDTRDGQELHGAACHACLFAPETSCEMGNAWLDRSLIVPTLDNLGLEFFQGRL